MKILLEKSKYHKFALYFDYTPSKVEFCKDLKDSFGWDKFSFDVHGELKRWVFSDSIFIQILAEKFPEIQIDEEVHDTARSEKKWIKEEKSKNERIDVIRTKETTDFEVKGLKGEMYAYQKVGVEFLEASGGRAIIADEMGCLEGETVIQVNRGGNCRKYKLKDIYSGFNGLRKEKNYNWRLKSYTRSFNKETGEFGLNEIKKVLYKGKKKTIKIKTETGKELILTPDHELLSEEKEWIEAKDFTIGDKLYINGTQVCSDCGSSEDVITYKYAKFKGLCKKCVYKNYRKLKNDVWSKKRISKTDGYVYLKGRKYHDHSRYSSSGLLEHIWVMEQKIGTSIPNGKQVHHINKIRHDNRIENLEILSIRDHSKKHRAHRHFKDCFIPKLDEIIEIEEAGLEDVYDIVMADPHRNFIANGVIVHNCGKSLQALAYIKYKGFKRSLIVCPASVKFSWENEVKKWTNMSSVVIDSKTDLASIDSSVNIWIINYDILKKHYPQLSKIKFYNTVSDECVMLKSPKALRTKAFRALASEIGSVVLLSGTPLLSRPSELYSLLNIIDPARWTNWYEYATKYCNLRQTRWGMDSSGVSNAEELHSLIKRYFIRREKKDVLAELPPKIFVDIPVQLDTKTKKEYDSAATDLANYLRDYAGKKNPEIARSMSAEKLTQLNILRKLSAMGKMKAALELIESIVDSGEKVLVFSSFVEPLVLLQSKIKSQSVMITGKTPVGERGEIVDKFQNDNNVKVFLGGTKSAGVGITLTAASSVIFLDYSFNPADLLQAQDRAHRIGTKAKSVNVYFLHAKGTIDEDLKEMIHVKQEIFDQIIDGKFEKKKSTDIMKITTDRILKEY